MFKPFFCLLRAFCKTSRYNRTGKSLLVVPATRLGSVIVFYLSNSLVLSGCSLFQGDTSLEPMELQDFDRKVKVERLWSIDTGSGTAKRQVADLSAELFFKTVDGVESTYLAAADKKGQISVWSFKENKESNDDTNSIGEVDLTRSPKRVASKGLASRLTSGPEADSDRLYVVDEDATLYAFDTISLKVLWTKELSSEATAKPASNGRKVAVRTIDGALSVFDAVSGELQWDYRHELPALSLRSQAQPLVTDSEVIVGFETGHLRAMNLSDGSLVWQVRVAQPTGRTDLERVVDVDTKAIIDGGSVYTASYQGNIVSIDRSQGRAEWRQPFSTAQNLSYQDGSIAGVSSESEVILIDAYSGTAEWRNDLLLRRGLGAPLLTQDYVLVCDNKGWLHVLDRSDGQMIGRRQLGNTSNHIALLALDANNYLLDTGRGKLRAFTIIELDSIDKSSESDDSVGNEDNLDSSDSINLDFGSGLGTTVPGLLDNGDEAGKADNDTDDDDDDS